MFSLLFIYFVPQFFLSGTAAMLLVHNILVVFSKFIFTGDKVCALWYGKGLIRTRFIAVVASLCNR